ncbi:MAG: hypothetical protein QM743_10710 [Chitinophagaceae bacterium]
MNKNILKIGLVATLGFAASMSACKKDDKKSTSMPSSSTWSIDSKSYTSVTKTYNDSSYAFASMDGSSVSLFFDAIPSASKSYTVTGSIDDKVHILTTQMSPLTIGTGISGTVNVTVADGKVRMQMTDVIIEIDDPSTGDSVRTAKLSSDLVH